MTTAPVLCIGDSITDADRLADPAGLGTGWVRLAADALRGRGDARPVVNRGVAGDRIVDLARRWRTDVLDLRPDVLTVYIGVNDTWRRYDSGDATSAEAFEATYRDLLDQAVGLCAPHLILMEPFLTPVAADQEAWLEDLDPKRAAVRRLAEAFDAGFVPVHERLTAAARTHGPAAVADDGVHPTALGCRLIADAWLGTFAST